MRNCNACNNPAEKCPHCSRKHDLCGLHNALRHNIHAASTRKAPPKASHKRTKKG